MDYKIYAVRIGDKYGIHYEHDLEQKLGPITWIREAEPDISLQWNKLRAFEADEIQPIVLIDIDLNFVGRYTDLFELPIERGEFLVTRNWWGQDNPTPKHYKIAGGFYKFWPQDTRYIAETFRKDKEYWQAHYIEQGITCGPVNGEMNFVEDCVRGRCGTEKLKMKFVPDAWHTKWKNNPCSDYQFMMNEKYKHDYLWMGGFHPDIRLIHYPMEKELKSGKEKQVQKWNYSSE